ncbi:MAG: ABC transporter ATP-binding protein [Neisseria sp.]|nr:ABC transporter ATP-binding protein [Neisseria sp.]
MISVHNLDFYYDDKQVLFDISVELPQGSITGLIGPNGAGKSTLMRCMAGLEIPEAGKVVLDGSPVLENPRASFAKLGYLPDLFGLSDGLTVIQCLTYAAKSRGLSDDLLDGVMTETVRLLGLDNKLYSKVNDLSRGQKQRVGIGQVIVHRPKFLLLDEPASGLDPDARHELSQLLLLLKKEGMTILVSSHILSELDEYCSHMLVIKEGRIQAFETLHEDAAGQQTLLLRFSGRADEALQTVRATAGVHHAELRDGAVIVTLDAGEEARAALLRELIGRGLPLNESSVVKNTLLQSYQNSLKSAGRQI